MEKSNLVVPLERPNCNPMDLPFLQRFACFGTLIFKGDKTGTNNNGGVKFGGAFADRISWFDGQSLY